MPRMKKLLLLIAFIAGLSKVCAQSYTYHPLKEFRGDTIAFLKHNFYDQRSYFIGKKFEVLINQYIWEMPLKDCESQGTSPYIDPKGKTYLCGAWLRSMECTPVRSDTACAVNTASIVVTFVPPYTVDDDVFCYNQPDDITPYGVANLLKDYIIKDIKIDIFDRRRKY